MTAPLLGRLAALSAAPVPGGAPESGPVSGTAPEVLADRPDGTLVRSGRTVAKAHAPDCDPRDLAARLAVAAHPLLHGILLPPLPLTAPDGHLTLAEDGRPLTRWPYGSPVSPDDPDAAPWEDAARLLARLHSVDPRQLAGPVPPMRGPAKAARALTRLRTARTTHPPRPGPGPLSAAADAIERAWAALPPWARGAAPPPHSAHLCHGDLHLGQLVRHPPADGRWLLIDIDDLGLGNPAWDLARPAAWFATGLLAPDIWSRFLAAYRAAGGPAVPPDGDPWPDLEIPARTLTVQTAALAVAKAHAASRPLDEVESAVVDACARMTSLPQQLAPGASDVG
ncbi:aminoglycoside phosphotransferase family protein [Streptomyces piniterrae]|uniref:Aminoglycoside phosphotransferase family protein n=1 Tax=Streptomyces piniterrae TaxID=2571125 RepID=A0A4U0MMC7_9ACTN|nr:aminoglycoside phosphotransferase family protein [Streptomyces piniterrae]TJZ41900.1 aminoglycoside phosphotransferase family protein [Streptomyces piniterrae]